MVMIVCSSDLILMKITELASFGFAASDRMKQGSIQSVVVSLLRLIGIALLMALAPHVTLSSWVWVYLVSSLLGMAFAIYKGIELWGMPTPRSAGIAGRCCGRRVLQYRQLGNDRVQRHRQDHVRQVVRLCSHGRLRGCLSSHRRKHDAGTGRLSRLPTRNFSAKGSMAYAQPIATPWR